MRSKSAIIISCAGCGRKVRVAPERFGQAGVCPQCKTPFPAVFLERLSGGDVGPQFVRGLWLACWGYLAGIGLLAATMLIASESFWAGTLLLFSPRWLFALPLLVLVPLAAWKKRSALVPLGIAGVIWLFPFSGFTVNWPSAEDADGPEHALRIVTCNMQGGGIDYVAFNAYLQQTQPDLVLLQEWTDGHRSAAFRDEKWQLVESGGLWAASRLPIRSLEGMPRGQLLLSAGAGAYQIDAPGGEVTIANIHSPTPRDGISSVIHRRLRGIAALKANTASRNDVSQQIRQFANQNAAADIVAGDFNMPVESSIYRQHWGDFGNAFSSCGFGWGGSKHTSWHTVRIDHVLHNQAWRCVHAALGPDIGSDHRPVFAVLERVE